VSDQGDCIRLQVAGGETGALRDAFEHPLADLFVTMKREDDVGPVGALQRAV